MINNTDVAKENALPQWLFTYQPLEEHRFEVIKLFVLIIHLPKVGMLLEVLDPLNRLRFVPAYVHEVLNRHYFNVLILLQNVVYYVNTKIGLSHPGY